MSKNIAPYGLELKENVDVIKDLSVSKGTDGTWLHFKSSKGTQNPLYLLY